MEEFEQMQETMFNSSTPEELSMTGRKQPKMNKQALKIKFRLSHRGNIELVEFPKSYSFRACTKPLASLERTIISELRVNVPAEGKYLLLRTIELPVKSEDLPIVFGTSILLLVEDHLGEVTTCCLYGHVFFEFEKPIDDTLPVSTVFVLKEPCLKACSTDSFAVVVGSPSDFVIIDRIHELAKELERLGWRDELTIDGSSEHASELSLQWKVKGNEFFKQRKHEQALEAYLVALRYAEASETNLILNLNLAGTYLTLGYFELALDYATKVLEMNPTNQKALFRAGRANYELRHYADAKCHFENLLLVYPSNTKAVSELARCNARLEEGKGFIDIYKLHCMNHENPLTPIDCGKYIGPVQVPSFPSDTRGIFAKEDIKPGTLILLEKSIAVSTVPSMSSDSGIGEFIKNVIKSVSRNPKTFGKQIYCLSTGIPEIDGNQNMFCGEENDLELIVDVYRIHKIFFNNIFNIGHSIGSFYPIIWQFFGTASKFNHSCMGNSTFLVYNDVILVRTCSFISKGEEIKLPYFSYYLNSSVKKFWLQMYHIECKCLLCEADRAEPERMHLCRDALCDEMKALAVPGLLNRAHLGSVVSRMKLSYLNRSSLRVHLFRMYLPVAEMLKTLAVENWDSDFMDLIEDGLKGIGLSVEALLRAAENEDAYLPRNALICNDLFEYAALMAEKESECKRTDQVLRWVKVLMFLEGIFRGGNLQMLQGRFQSDRKVVEILSSIHR